MTSEVAKPQRVTPPVESWWERKSQSTSASPTVTRRSGMLCARWASGSKKSASHNDGGEAVAALRVFGEGRRGKGASEEHRKQDGTETTGATQSFHFRVPIWTQTSRSTQLPQTVPEGYRVDKSPQVASTVRSSAQ